MQISAINAENLVVGAGNRIVAGMLRQMVGVITTHEAGMGLVAERATEHLDVEGGGLRLVDRLLGVTGILLGVTGIGSDEGCNGGDDPVVFHGRLGLIARHITLVAAGAGAFDARSAK